MNRAVVALRLSAACRIGVSAGPNCLDAVNIIASTRKSIHYIWNLHFSLNYLLFQEAFFFLILEVYETGFSDPIVVLGEWRIGSGDSESKKCCIVFHNQDRTIKF